LGSPGRRINERAWRGNLIGLERGGFAHSIKPGGRTEARGGARFPLKGEQLAAE